MRRGDLVTVAMSGPYGKPRPAVIIQADSFEHVQSVTFLPLTSDITEALTFRVLIEPSSENRLRATSQVMADKCSTLPRNKVGDVFGRLTDSDMTAVNRALAIFLGFV
ncbi:MULTISPECIES: type II toxin-antitoxin system PemK/MazF family toxin [Rhodopseudomonas]|uniref:Growth inhibitor PemK n=1 Tax=Rhodopseudomonas palustris TaxID=1076 RepID=A0A0D7EX30_RHOPL|nr:MULTISPECIES: type II toxin-antitoxin system PemK/MazF family toxin [Rhodopseudomonas]KIZ44002.1 growth inhibitor PemK [Rhodopseudomonas palustris]MDF3810345.1 type II toxin-antitoxin system PemK/MazF family toxin [Rhodopseudomonas sp. BAL398]WOK17176.1 type II toxin-antitoxin system PemK/MazF family toxin [Rhodopseudomonas sp. BAL398]